MEFVYIIVDQGKIVATYACRNAAEEVLKQCPPTFSIVTERLIRDPCEC